MQELHGFAESYVDTSDSLTFHFTSAAAAAINPEQNQFRVRMSEKTFSNRNGTVAHTAAVDCGTAQSTLSHCR